MDAEAMVADIAEVVGRHAARAETRTAIPRMTLWRSHGPTEPVPALLRPKLYLLLQGRKRMTIGGRQLDFAPGRFSVSSLGLPFTAQVVEASPVAPYLGLEVALDPGVIAGLLLDAPDLGGGTVPAIAVSEATADLLEPLGRLLRLLDVPADIPVLAPAFERELCYRLLQGPLGGRLRQVVGRTSRFGQVRTAAEWICANADRPMRVADLAASVAMSVTSFHRHFRLVTGLSPLAYQRHIRLVEARRLIASGATDVTRAAFAMGYASASQFSREYKGLFGVPPVRDTLASRP